VLHLVTQVSLGDFVLTGGEIPALAIINGVVRLLPGTVGKLESLKAESLRQGYWTIPNIPAQLSFGVEGARCTSGNHAEIARWRHEQQIQRTRDRRPDLLAGGSESPAVTVICF